jgi:hypothetical protein
MRAVHNIFDFSKALLETAMENSMERSRTRLGPGCVFSVEPVKVGTFDFELAHKEIIDQGGSYELVRERAGKYFNDFVDRYRRTEQVKSGEKVNQILVGDPWKNQSLAMMDQLGKVYQAYQNDKCSYSSCSVVVKARCLIEEGAAEGGQPDMVRYSMEFDTLDVPIFCHSVVLSSSSNAAYTTSLESTSWMILDVKNDRQIRAIDLPMRSSRAEDVRELLLFLDPVLPAKSGPYRFDFQDLIQDFMKPLRDTRKDELVFTPRRAQGKIKNIDLVLWVPTRFTTARMIPQNNGLGRPMTATELGSPLYIPPPGFRSLGWRGEGLPADQAFGVDVQI